MRRVSPVPVPPFHHKAKTTRLKANFCFDKIDEIFPARLVNFPSLHLLPIGDMTVSPLSTQRSFLVQ